jgi:hypothetical protein
MVTAQRAGLLDVMQNALGRRVEQWSPEEVAPTGEFAAPPDTLVYPQSVEIGKRFRAALFGASAAGKESRAGRKSAYSCSAAS